MIVHLDKSKLFTIEPALRFSREYHTSPEMWRELWKRHNLMEYTVQDVCEFYMIKTGRTIHPKSVHRWIARTHIYTLGNAARKKGARVVVSDYFGRYEDDVIYELTKGMRFSGTKNPVGLA